MENYLYFKYFKIVADSGYETEENYVYVKENGQLSYIKPANYEIQSDRTETHLFHLKKVLRFKT